MPLPASPAAGPVRAPGRLAPLDGVRGFAALAVVLAHAAVFMGALPYAPLGAIGVVVFFALSGYLIGGIVWRAPATVSSYVRFLRRRVVRLAPVVLAMSLVTGLLVVALDPASSAAAWTSVRASLTQTTAFVMASGASTHPAFDPTWSLTVEWTFYLLAPLLLMALRRRGLPASTCSRVQWGLAVLLYGGGLALTPTAFYLLPVANLGVLFAGSALATGHLAAEASGRPLTWDSGRTRMALVLLVLLTVLPGHTLSWGWKASAFPAAAVTALVVIHACRAGDPATRVLARGPLAQVGLRAYSLYLWHLPVMWLVFVSMPGVAHGLRAVVALVVTALVTVVSFELLERPVLRGRVPATRSSADVVVSAPTRGAVSPT